MTSVGIGAGGSASIAIRARVASPSAFGCGKEGVQGRPSIGGFGFGLSQLLFAYIVWQTARGGVKASTRVWEGARGLEWTLSSPPPFHSFSTPPVIRDGDLAHGDITH